ncbi:hypothetical protein JW758_05820 [Candidatus Peregrinibacteria bacterium]|nr:hypothetical protein [Candidatus Peregrinibacteria bacterium]
MKNKYNFLTIILGLIFLVPSVYAAKPITGTAYGENIGLIHFNYTTTVVPDPLNTPDYIQGPDNEIYVSPVLSEYNPTAEYTALNMAYNPAFISSISDISDCVGGYCKLSGFAWSTKIGWMILSGDVLRSSIEALGGTFDDNQYARASTTTGVFLGYIWSEKTGWIKLSSDGFNYANPQTATNWGVRMDPLAPMEPMLVSDECEGLDEASCNDISRICIWDSTECQPKGIQVGRPLVGYAWSEHLGWIKFDKDTGDFFNGVYTTWVPDTTPPEFNVDGDNIWFANDNEYGMIVWDNFAYDPESGIDTEETKFVITSDNPQCANALDDTDGDNANNTYRFIDYDTMNLTLRLPTLGIVDTDEGYCEYELTGTMVNGAGLDTDVSLTFFVRAGDYDEALSSVDYSATTCVDPSSLTAIADGNDCYEYRFNPVDIAGNPIVSVEVDVTGAPADSADWMRNVSSTYAFESSTYFDEVNPPIGAHAVPIILDSGSLLSQVSNEQLMYTTDEPINGHYSVKVYALAPTLGENDFDIDSIRLNSEEAEMPPISNDALATPAMPVELFRDAETVLAYAPAITVTGIADTDVLVPSVDAGITISMINNSSNVDIDSIAIDNRLYYENAENEPDKIGKQVLDMRNIAEGAGIQPDVFIGRSDPVNVYARYLVMTNDNDQIDNVYHTSSGNIHTEPYSFQFSSNPPLDSEVLSSGQYEASGIYDMTVEEKKEYIDSISNVDPSDDIDPGTISVDRNDILTIGGLDSGSIGSYTFTFTPNQFLNTAPNTDVIFGVHQYVAYKLENPLDLYTVYEVPDTISDIQFKSIGIQTTGSVTGSNVYDTVSGRDLDTITPTDSGELQRQIRSNVASLTRNMNLEGCNGVSLSELPTDPDNECIVVDDINKTIIAVYTSDVTLNNNIEVPEDTSYTLILKDGANLIIQGNILQSNSISFGIIALADEDEKGGNVYISPEPTNINALLYAEGSLLSISGGAPCYSNTNPSCELRNQLYWKGSIVSRNTIGGAPSGTLPPGINRITDCPGVDAATCAQKYDMDYIRRFVLRAYKDAGTGAVIGHYSADGVKYSGGNQCIPGTPPNCSFGGDTTMTQDGTLINQENSLSTDPFFIEQDTRPAPPGFTTSAGLGRSQIIR